MALSGRFASKIKGFMTEGIKKLYDEESTSLSRDFIAPKTTRQQVQEAQATTVTPTDISHEQIPEDTLPFQRERVRKLQKIEEENLGLPIKSKVEEVGAYVNPLSPSDPNYDPKYWENVSSAATKKVIKPGMNKFGEFEPTSYWLHERQRIGDLNLPRGFKLKPNEYPLLNKDRTQFKGSLRKAFQKNGFNTDTLYDFFNEKNPEDAINILWEAQGTPKKVPQQLSVTRAKKQLHEAGQEYLKRGTNLDELPNIIFVYRYGNVPKSSAIPFTTRPDFTGHSIWSTMRAKRKGKVLPLVKYRVNTEDILAVPNSIKDFERISPGTWDENEVIILGRDVRKVEEVKTPSPLQKQIHSLGLSKIEQAEIAIPEPIDISDKNILKDFQDDPIPEAAKRSYMKAEEQGYTVPLFHVSKIGEKIQFDPRGEGKGWLDPVYFKQEIKEHGESAKDIGIHLGIPTTQEKMTRVKSINETIDESPEVALDLETADDLSDKMIPAPGGVIPEGSTVFPVMTKLDKVAIVPDMGRFKIPSKWLQNLAGMPYEVNPRATTRGILRKNNLENDFDGNINDIQDTLDPSIETVEDFKRYVKEKGDFVFWPKDGNLIYFKNIDTRLMSAKSFRFTEVFKGMPPDLWKQLIEIAHSFNEKNKKLFREYARRTFSNDPNNLDLYMAETYIPDDIHPSLIDDWYKALRNVLEKGEYDAFAYPNMTEDYGAFSYMFLDPRKIKSIFAKDFDPESFSFGKKSGGIVDMRNGGRVGR